MIISVEVSLPFPALWFHCRQS